MEQNLREELVLETSKKSHQLWCDNEIRDFFNRLAMQQDENIEVRFKKACVKDGIIRNEVSINLNYLDELDKACHDFNVFVKLINDGVICVKRFVKRDVFADEFDKLGSDFIDGKENILKDFVDLSTSSKKESLDGASSAVNIYIALSEAGISIRDMEYNASIRNIIGTYIHTEWLKRNKNHPNKSLMVPFSQLDEFEKKQDLNIFDIMLSVVKDNDDKYHISSLNTPLPNYIEDECEVLKQL